MKGKFEVVTDDDNIATNSTSSIPGPSPKIEDNDNDIDNDGEISFVGEQQGGN